MKYLMNLSFKIQISLFVSIVSVMLIVSGFISYNSSVSIVNTLTNLYDDSFVPLDMINNMKNNIIIIDSDAKQLILEEKNLASFRQLNFRINNYFKRTDDIMMEYRKKSMSKFEKKWIRILIKEFNQYRVETDKAIKMKENGQDERADKYYFNKAVPEFDSFDSILKGLTENVVEKAQKQNTISKNLVKRTNYIILMILIAGIVLEVAIGHLFILWLTAPLKRLILQIRKIAKGDYSVHKAHDYPKNEVGELSIAINNMSQELDRMHTEKEDINTHLEEIVKQRTRELEIKTRLLEKMATHDTLTELPNKRLFDRNLKRAIDESRKSKNIVCVIYLDLDGFKTINDRLGHDRGDIVIKIIAKRIWQSISDNDTVSRMGGDEFTIILTEITNRNTLRIFCQNLIEKISREIKLDDRYWSLTASAGISIFPDDGDNPGVLIKNADNAMYYAKKLGKNNFIFFSDIKNTIKKDSADINIDSMNIMKTGVDLSDK